MNPTLLNEHRHRLRLSAALLFPVAAMVQPAPNAVAASARTPGRRSRFLWRDFLTDYAQLLFK